jgi:hypothetical protein
MPEQLSIEVLKPSEARAYDAFVLSCPHAMIYHSWQYKELIKKLLNVEEHYFVAKDSAGTIVGVLPMLYKDGPFGKVYNSLPFYGSNGGVLANDKEVFNFLLTAYNEFVSTEDIAAATLITNPLKDDDYSGIVKNYEDYRIGQFSPIKFSENHTEALMTLFHYKTRNVIRKAMKEGVELHIDNTAIDFIFDTHKQNIEAIGGKHKTKEFFDLFPHYFTAGIDYNIYLATYTGETIAGVLVFYFKNTVEYYTPVIVEQFRDKQALSYLIYQAMIDASQKGFELWNWGGTWATQGGVYSFKKRWGTQDINYYYHTLIRNKEILNAKRSDLLSHYDNLFVINFKELAAETV